MFFPLLQQWVNLFVFFLQLFSSCLASPTSAYQMGEISLTAAPCSLALKAPCLTTLGCPSQTRPSSWKLESWMIALNSGICGALPILCLLPTMILSLSQNRLAVPSSRSFCRRSIGSQIHRPDRVEAVLPPARSQISTLICC